MTNGDFALICLFALPVLGSILGSIYFGSEGKPIHNDDSDEVEEYAPYDPFCRTPDIYPNVTNHLSSRYRDISDD